MKRVRTSLAQRVKRLERGTSNKSFSLVRTNTALQTVNSNVVVNHYESLAGDFNDGQPSAQLTIRRHLMWVEGAWQNTGTPVCNTLGIGIQVCSLPPGGGTGITQANVGSVLEPQDADRRWKFTWAFACSSASPGSRLSNSPVARTHFDLRPNARLDRDQVYVLNLAWFGLNATDNIAVHIWHKLLIEQS